MPRYYFNVANDFEFPDTSGLTLRNAGEAREHAVNLAISIAEKGNKRLRPAVIVVTDENGGRLFEIPVASGEHARKPDRA
jgi:hypothetical protein